MTDYPALESGGVIYGVSILVNGIDRDWQHQLTLDEIAVRLEAASEAISPSLLHAGQPDHRLRIHGEAVFISDKPIIDQTKEDVAAALRGAEHALRSSHEDFETAQIDLYVLQLQCAKGGPLLSQPFDEEVFG